MHLAYEADICPTLTVSTAHYFTTRSCSPEVCASFPLRTDPKPEDAVYHFMRHTRTCAQACWWSDALATRAVLGELGPMCVLAMSNYSTSSDPSSHAADALTLVGHRSCYCASLRHMPITCT